MRAPLLALKLLLTTVSAVATAYYAVASITLSGLWPSNWTAADVVRQRCPVHLVRPEWIKGTDQGDILFNWAVTEVRARLAVIVAFWVLAVSLLLWQGFRGRSDKSEA